MHIQTAVAVAALAVMLQTPAGQMRLGGQTDPTTLLPTSEGIIASIGSREDADAVMAKAFKTYLATVSDGSPAVAAAQVRETWLPAEWRSKVRRLSDDDAENLYVGCGVLTFVRSVTVKDGRLEIEIGAGTKCRSQGSFFRFTHDETGWHLVERTGGGFVRGVECRCP